MKTHEMREMTLEELKMHHDNIVEELANLRIKLAIKQLDNPLKVRELKREIARAKTILKEKEAGTLPGEKPRSTGASSRDSRKETGPSQGETGSSPVES